ncbi:response regulator transcription factor [Prosthecomicrobium sp. N25]|uniref:response regulator transcription factor n=1 Tax=Prosthecomicrobium sp. N25 TaxID=3129254 RepID=UPI0030781C11
MTILVIEDDPDIGSLLRRGLAEEGYDVAVVDTGAAALPEARRLSPEAVILDVMLPDTTGLEICRSLRADGFGMPIVMLSAKAAISERAEGLEAGADDYVVKPFAFGELVARLKTHILRRSEAVPSSRYLVGGPLTLDLETRIARYGEAEARLTEREASLLILLMRAPGRPVSRGDIFDRLWADQGGASLNVVDVYVGYLRHKLGDITPPGRQLIETVRGRGFMFRAEA